jgi:hypothetical protein
MKYACLIYDDGIPPESEAEGEAIHAEYMALYQDGMSKGILVSGDGLAGVDSATTVRVRDGKRSTTDGPFAETKEVLAGIFVLDVPTLDDALAFAARIPSVRWGSVEVRPFWSPGE